MKLSVVIQAGGESSRMGRNKAVIDFMGQPLIQRVIGRVAGLADELLVTANDAAAVNFLPFPVVPDVFPGRGALGGLYTALSAARHPLVAVVACDMAFASAPVLAAERDILLSEAYDGVVPRTDAGNEPFHAVYRREACLEAVSVALQASRFRVDAWFDQANLYFMPAGEIARYDPRGEAFININTPADLLAAEIRARG